MLELIKMQITDVLELMRRSQIHLALVTLRGSIGVTLDDVMRGLVGPLSNEP